MRIHFYCPTHMERWDHRSIDNGGIGGSETAVVEVSRRLAKEHDVAVYAPLAKYCKPQKDGVSWRKLEELDPTEDALWVLQRCPAELLEHEWKGTLWLHLHDVINRHAWDPKWSEKADKILCQSQMHAMSAERLLEGVNGRVAWVGSGCRTELFEKIEKAETIERNPKKLIWASDLFRGLGQVLLPLWPVVRRIVPDAELHIFYGWQVMQGIIDGPDPVRSVHMKQVKAEIESMIDQPGIYFRGRVGQDELYREWLSSGVWPYWTEFPEVCCIAAMEAQCGGAIPVTNPWWALRENVKHGIFIPGKPYEDQYVQDEYVEATTTLLQHGPAQGQCRDAMMPEARERCSWDAVMKKWEENLCS